jgi:DNA polymerase III delta prime subunit
MNSKIQISKEQESILDSIKNGHNVVINANPGSGKTTTSIHIMRTFHTERIISLTFSRKLYIDGREKLRQLGMLEERYDFIGIDSFSYTYYGDSCSNMNSIKKRNFCYNIIIIDESQDLGFKHYNFLRKMLKDNDDHNPILVILGDHRQCIFSNMDSIMSDVRFLTLARKIYVSRRKWENRFLTESFRLTNTMCDFINNVLLNSTVSIIRSSKHSYYKPNYIIYSNFKEICEEIFYYKGMGYKNDDIFIISPSVDKSNLISEVSNYLTLHGVNIYIHRNDSTAYEYENGVNKIVILTNFACKGLERKVVILFNFDGSLYRFNRNESQIECPNILFVSSTRALERITFCHEVTFSFLPFIDERKLLNYCNVIRRSIKHIPPRPTLKGNTESSSVTHLLKFVNEVYLKKIYDRFNIIKILNSRNKIIIPHSIKCKTLTEPVSDITGTAIVAAYELKNFNKMTIFNECNILHKKIHEDYFSDKKFLKYLDFNEFHKTKWIEGLLLIATYYDACYTNCFNRLKQINHYDWITNENITDCFNNLDYCFNCLGVEDISCGKYEINVFSEDIKTEGIKYKDKIYTMTGSIDYINGNKIFEFKCKEKLTCVDFIQLMIYKYLYERQFKDKTECYLFNILTSELYKVDCDSEDILHSIIELFEIKNNYGMPINEEEFLEKCESLII